MWQELCRYRGRVQKIPVIELVIGLFHPGTAVDIHKQRNRTFRILGYPKAEIQAFGAARLKAHICTCIFRGELSIVYSTRIYRHSRNGVILPLSYFRFGGIPSCLAQTVCDNSIILSHSMVTILIAAGIVLNTLFFPSNTSSTNKNQKKNIPHPTAYAAIRK